MTRQPVQRSTWRVPALVVIAVIGILISIYLTLTHAGSAPLVCTIGAAVNCAAVTHSAYSVIPATSIPISTLGVLWFLISGGLAIWTRNEAHGARAAHLVWAAVGLAVVLYLLCVEIVILHQICEWCTVVHLLVIATFVVALYGVQQDGA